MCVREFCVGYNQWCLGVTLDSVLWGHSWCCSEDQSNWNWLHARQLTAYAISLAHTKKNFHNIPLIKISGLVSLQVTSENEVVGNKKTLAFGINECLWDMSLRYGCLGSSNMVVLFLIKRHNLLENAELYSKGKWIFGRTLGSHISALV